MCKLQPDSGCKKTQIMNITRNNYETYFLLYADGELNAADKLAVEHFIQLHPDLADELDMLLDTVFQPEDITMPGKNLLLKPEVWDADSLTPKQEALLLLLDNELHGKRRTALETEIQSDSVLAKEWSILQQSTLDTAAIEMPEKESLYRKERHRKPVAYISLVRWMAAAAVLAGLGWYALSALTNEQPRQGTPGVAALVPDKKAVEPVHTTTTEKLAPANETTTNAPEPAATVTGKESIPGAPVLATNYDQKKVTPEVNTENAQQEPSSVSPEKQQLIETVPQANITSAATPAVDLAQMNNPLENQAVQKDDASQLIAQHAVYNEDDVDDDEYVSIAGARIKKQKLRGVFRNVTRTVSRTFDKSNVAQADNVAPLR